MDDKSDDKTFSICDIYKNKKVLSPKIWFGSQSQHNIDDLITSEWKKI